MSTAKPESTPGDYYAAKAEEAKRLREALNIELQKINPDRQVVAGLKKALELALYVGD